MKAAKETTLKPRSRKEGNVAPVPDLIVEAAEEEDEDQKCLKKAQDSLRHARALFDVEVKPKKKTIVSKIQAGMSMKRGCQCNFVGKQLMVDETLCTISFHCMDHYNREGKPCHYGDFGGQRSGLSGRLSHVTKQWIIDTLRSGKSLAQVMAEHKAEVMRLVENNLPASRHTFIMPSDVYNIANKLAKEL